MKKQLLSMIVSAMLGVSSMGYAQQAATTPEGFKYQASLRNKQGEVIANKLVSIRISILSKGTNLKGGNTEAVYSEVHTVSTNRLGMVSFEIGHGTNVIGDFSSINWGSSEHFVQIEMDESGGDNFKILGTSQLMAVPYSLHAKMAGDVMPGSITIQNEIAARKEADQMLQSQVNIIRQLLEQKGAGKDGADNTLGVPQDLADLKERYLADSAAKSSRLNYELTRFTNDSAAKQTQITNNLTRFINDSTAKNTTINDNLTRFMNDSVAVRALIAILQNDTQAQITNNLTRFTNDSTALRNLIASEVARATAAEQANATAIANEAATARAAEAGLDSRVDALEATDAAQATTNATLQAAIDAEAATARAAEQTNASAIAAETARATAAETTLDGKITTEKSRAEAAEAALQSAITSEAATARAAEQANASAISAETTRAQDAESGLDTRVDALEATDAAQATTNAGLQTAIDNEVSRATAAEATLTTNLDAEITRATAAEQANANAIASEAATARAAEQTNAAAITAETNRATAAESTLDGKITTEKSRAEAAEAALQTAVTNEAATARAAESGLDTRVDALEATDVTQATTSAGLQAQITAEVDRATGVDAAQATTNAAQAANNASQASDIAANTAAITAETTRATAAENGLNSSITTEKNRAETAEAVLDTRVDALEATDAAQATTNTNLQATIDAEAVTARAAEQANATAIANEASRAQAAETTLSNSITTEQTRAEAAEAALNSEIAGETTRAVAAESGLDTRVDALEASDATQATTNTNLQNAITTESARAQAAEMGLQTQATNNLTRFTNDSVALRSLITSTSANLWSKSGNSASSTDFIGTTNAQDIVLKRNNVTSQQIYTGGATVWTGDVSTGVTPLSGAGSRMMWIPNKKAFRVGQVDGTQWDNASIGEHSFATGLNTTASALFSTAIGRGTIASGHHSTAMGYYTTASSGYTTSMGVGTVASGSHSTAMGNYVSTNGQEGSFIFGDHSTTSPLNSSAANQFTARFAGGFRFMGGDVTAQNLAGTGTRMVVADANGTLSTQPLTSSGWGLTGNSASSTDFIGTTNAAALVLKTNNADRLHITTEGNVGIGTDTPSNKLEVAGSVKITGPVEINTTSGSLLLPRLTTVQRNALTAKEGMVIFNTTSSAFQAYYPEGANGNGGAETLDQNHYSTSYNNRSSNIAQSFTAGATGKLSRITINTKYIDCAWYLNCGGNATLYIRSGEGTGGTILSTQTVYIPNSSGEKSFSITGSTVNVTAGSVYTFQFVRSSSKPGINYNSGAGIDYYGGGKMFIDGNASTGDDLSFKTYIVTGEWKNIISSPNDGSSGPHSFAIGYNSTASGPHSTAMGVGTVASGNHSTAMGYYTTASNNYTTSMGFGTVASGSHSTAMGNYVSTNGQEGSFILGDHSTSTVRTSTATNQFSARFAGGYNLYTNSETSLGVSLAASGNSWSSISDSTKKENVVIADGEEFLKKISTMRLGSWNYKAQDAKTLRHYGPMAQEMFSLFGHDGVGTIGNDTTIASADIDGVMMIAIQALEKRTQELQEKNSEIEALKAELNEMKSLRAEVKALKAAQQETEILKIRMQKLERLLEDQEVKMVMSREDDK